jgi:homogentisate solanesyltransferase
MELEAPVVEADPARSRGGGGEEDTLQTRTLLPCPNCDVQVVHKLAQLLLPGLAAACVDSTLRNPSSSLAVQLRAELVQYITDRSNSPPEFPAETGDDDPLADRDDDPGDTLATFLDDFAGSKRSIVVSISGWLPYLGGEDGRDDRIDDLVQEMEASRFWPIERREAVARDLLRGLDVVVAGDGRFRCRDELDTEEKLADHVAGRCRFRPVRCRNQVQGCTAEVSACRAEEHDEACGFKLLPCEQGCGLGVARRQMDRHCVTACPMKLENCPFYQLGCESAFPACNLGSHCEQFVGTHLRLLLGHNQSIAHRQDLDLEERLARLEKVGHIISSRLPELA